MLSKRPAQIIVQMQASWKILANPDSLALISLLIYPSCTSTNQMMPRFRAEEKRACFAVLENSDAVWNEIKTHLQILNMPPAIPTSSSSNQGTLANQIKTKPTKRHAFLVWRIVMRIGKKSPSEMKSTTCDSQILCINLKEASKV